MNNTGLLRAGESVDWRWFFLLLLAALLFRVYGFWLWDVVDDEFFTVTKAHERFDRFPNPTYYALVVLGYEVFGGSPWVARLPAVLFGVFSVPLLYAVWTPVVGRRIALIATSLLLFSAWHLWFTQYARFYSGVFFFATLSYAFFFRAIGSQSAGWLIAALAALGVAVSLHFTALLIGAGVGLAYGFLWLSASRQDRKAAPNLSRFLLLGIVAGVLSLPFVWQTMQWWIGTGQNWGYSGIKVLFQLVRYIQLPLVAAALVGMVALFFSERRTFFVLALCFTAPLAILVLASHVMAISPYYAYYLLPLIVIVGAYGIVEITRQLPASRELGATIGIFVLFAMPMAPNLVSHFTGRGTLDFADVEHFVSENYRSGDQVLSFIPGFELENRNARLLPFLGIERDNSVEWQEEIEKHWTTNGRLWIVVSSKRASLATELEQWLRCNSDLVWRAYARRYDYEVDGYEVYLAARVSAKTDIVQCVGDRR